MKRLNKKSVILAALALLLGGGAYLNYQMSKTDTAEMSDLTLANLEAMAFMDADMDGSGSWVNGPGHDVKCNRCGSVHSHCKGRNDSRCEQTSCL